jgi:hypothetical protein
VHCVSDFTRTPSAKRNRARPCRMSARRRSSSQHCVPNLGATPAGRSSLQPRRGGRTQPLAQGREQPSFRAILYLGAAIEEQHLDASAMPGKYLHRQCRFDAPTGPMNRYLRLR